MATTIPGPLPPQLLSLIMQLQQNPDALSSPNVLTPPDQAGQEPPQFPIDGTLPDVGPTQPQDTNIPTGAMTGPENPVHPKRDALLSLLPMLIAGGLGGALGGKMGAGSALNSYSEQKNLQQQMAAKQSQDRINNILAATKLGQEGANIQSEIGARNIGSKKTAMEIGNLGRTYAVGPNGELQEIPEGEQAPKGYDAYGTLQAAEAESKRRGNLGQFGQKVEELKKMGINPTTDQILRMAGAADTGTDDFQKIFLPAYAAKLWKKPAELSSDEVIGAFGEYAKAKTDPEVRASLLSSRATAEAMRKMQESQQPTPEQAKQVATDVVAHRIAPEQLASLFGGFGTSGQAFKRMVYLEAKKLDPEFDFEAASAEYVLTKSPGFQNTVRYMDSVQESIPLVIDRAKTLANGDVRSINSLLNAGKNQFNNVDLKRFQTDALLVADEIAKILQGGGTGSGTSDAKLSQAQKILTETDSPAAIAAALGDVNQLIGFRRKALTRGTYMENAQNSAKKNPFRKE
jgi:hypothetical protein